MSKALNSVAVDLTPMLPGGENGGAKIFVLELLHRLAVLAPNVKFILLTHGDSNDELAELDRPNVQRIVVVGSIATSSRRSQLVRYLVQVARLAPIRVQEGIHRLLGDLRWVVKRMNSSGVIRSMGVDLLFCPFTAPTYFDPRIPTVCTIYDLQYKTYPEFFSAEDAGHRDRFMVEACRRSSALAAISNYSRDSVIAYGKVDPARVRTIYLRMAKRFEPEAANALRVLRDLGLVSGNYLIYPANFWQHKNHEMLFTAFGMARHQGLAKEIKLVCTGAPGTRQSWLEEAARAMNLQHHILFPGYVSNAQLAALVMNSAGVVFPSLYEGFGMPVLEAMAAGVPVACSNTTSLPEVAHDAAIMFNPGVPSAIAQAMIALTTDEARRALLISAGARRALEFADPQRMAAEYLDLFQYALNYQRLENDLAGVYTDGWVGANLRLQVAPSKGPQTVEVELFAPDWLPQTRLTVRTSNESEQLGSTREFDRGTNVLISFTVESTGGFFEVSVVPTFVPALSGFGDDRRELSAMLKRCSILADGSGRIEMFTESDHA